MGVLSKQDALQKAYEEDLDLVEVAPNADPPVCRIMNFGKYRYEQQKKQQQAKKKNHGMELKELRLGKSTRIEKHDLEFKIKKAREILEKGHRLQIFLQLRGREIAHSELGVDRLNEFADALDDISKLEQEPKMLGKRINMLLTPAPEKKKKKKEEEAKKESDKKVENNPEPATTAEQETNSLVDESEEE